MNFPNLLWGLIPFAGLFLVLAFAPAADAGEDAPPCYMHDWHIAGPFPNVDGAGFDTEYPPEKGVELGAVYEGYANQPIRWRHLLREGEEELQPRPVNIRELYWERSNVCAYAYSVIHSDRAKDVTILAGSDDTITIWVNGEKLLARNVYRGAQPDTEKVDAHLREGDNEILLKICQGTGGWEFYFRIFDPEPGLLTKRHVLENNDVRLAFDYLGRLVELHDKRSDTACVVAGDGGVNDNTTPAPAFIADAYSAHQQIYINDPLLLGGGGFSQADPAALLSTERTGDLLRLDADKWNPPKISISESEDGSRTFACRTLLSGDIVAEFTVTLPAAGSLSYWRMNVANRADTLPRQHLRLYRMAFPILSNLRLGGDPQQNYLARPFIQGELIPNPSAYSFSRPGRAGSRTNVLTYPGWASMPWMDLYRVQPDAPGKTSGLYFASYDPQFQQVDIETVPNAEAGTISMATRTLAFLEPGEEWQSQAFVVGVHPGDWHWAADRYRADSAAWLRKHSAPAWLRETDGWLGSGLPNYRYDDLPKVLEDARWLGLNYIQLWAQMLENVGVDKKRKPYYCFFLPDPDRGGEEAMTQGVGKVREMGGHVGFYSNFWTFDADIHRGLEQWKDQIPPDVSIPNWHREFKNYASVFPDGRIEPGSYDDGYAGMCPAAKGWRDYLKFWIVDKYMKQYGVDAWYLDSFPVTMFGSDRVCFSPHHGDGRPHGMGQHLLQFARELHEAASEFGGLAVTSESAGDVFMQYNSHALGIELVGGITQYPRPEIYTYTFPEHIFFSGSCNNILGLPHYYPGLERPTRELAMMRVFMMGYRFDVLAYPVNRNDTYMNFLRSIIALRQKIKGELYASAFRDQDGLNRLPENVEAKIFRHNEGTSMTVTLLDHREIKAPLTLIINEARLNVQGIRRATLHTFDGQETALGIAQDKVGIVHITLPERADIPAAVVIQCEPAEAR